MKDAASLPPPPGLSGGIWGTTTYVGPLTFACAVASIQTIIGWIIILLFCPVDKMDVYKVEDKLYTADGKLYKAASTHNFAVSKSEHVVGGVPPGCSPKNTGSWGTTQHVGPLTWAVAICALPTVIGSILILLFMPLDNDDVYKEGDALYLADGTKFKAASDKNFDIRRSAHTTSGTPEGLSGGSWGTTTYVGPFTLALALAALPTVIGAIVILLFCPLDQEEVYNVDEKLYLPSGKLFKAASKNNFFIRKSEHTVTGAPKGLKGGEWGTTTHVGPLTFAFAFVALWSGVGWIIILLLLPLDSEEVYKVDNKLYLPDGELYKAVSKHNFRKKNSKHVRAERTDVEKADGEEEEEVPTTLEDGSKALEC
ncbi:unnamed protein product [Cylindrotheca closterium]|uniref:Uncharacterized protein n=1 Tax=Cylindrotheca closterium TaxID=2856 RepID=A0AAD2GC61_9STRA|nr:unnamed protein product [Cylindrotheca closterium]